MRTLRVLAVAEDLAVEVYGSTQNFPASERYGLAAQLRRAAVSVGLNIAEGCGRMGDGDFRRSLSIARGSLAELEFGLRVARRLEMIDQSGSERVRLIREQAGGMITLLIKRIDQSDHAPGRKTSARSARAPARVPGVNRQQLIANSQ